jgi:hypothetical protein
LLSASQEIGVESVETSRIGCWNGNSQARTVRPLELQTVCTCDLRLICRPRESGRQLEESGLSVAAIRFGHGLFRRSTQQSPGIKFQHSAHKRTRIAADHFERCIPQFVGYRFTVVLASFSPLVKAGFEFE